MHRIVMFFFTDISLRITLIRSTYNKAYDVFIFGCVEASAEAIGRKQFKISGTSIKFKNS